MSRSARPRLISVTLIAATAALVTVALAATTTAYGQSSQRLVNRLQLQQSMDDLSRSAQRTQRSIAEAERRIEQRTVRRAERLRLQGEVDFLRFQNGLQSRP